MSALSSGNAPIERLRSPFGSAASCLRWSCDKCGIFDLKKRFPGSSVRSGLVAKKVDPWSHISGGTGLSGAHWGQRLSKPAGKDLVAEGKLFSRSLVIAEPRLSNGDILGSILAQVKAL